MSYLDMDAWALSEEVAQLKRENAALREELQAQAVVNGKGSEREAKLMSQNVALRKQLNTESSTSTQEPEVEFRQSAIDDFNRVAAALSGEPEIERLKAENAALREDKARLDHLLKELAGPRPFWQWHNWTREQMIVALDAERARKEVQP